MSETCSNEEIKWRQTQRFRGECEKLIRTGAGHGGWQEMSEDNTRMAEWFDLQLLGKQPAKPFTYGTSSLPSTPAKR